jgi:hypothetical protein
MKMTLQRVIQFDYQQSLVQDSDRSGWSEDVSVSVRLLSEAITSGWYRIQFAGRGNDFVILLAIAMHARPLKGNDLKMLVNVHMATPEDEGRLYARVSDVALAEELGMSRMTIARASRRLVEDKSIVIVEIPEKLTTFRDSHGRFNGNKVYLIAGDLQNRFIEKSIEKVNHAIKTSTVEVSDNSHRALKSRSAAAHRDTNICKPAPNSCINAIDDEDDEEVTTGLFLRVFSYFAKRKGDPDYHPTIKEQIALEKLISDGFTFENIVAGIEVAFIRPYRPRYFTHCAAITRDLIRLQQESRTPEICQPQTREPEALEVPDQKEDLRPEILEPHLVRAVEVYRSSGREITNDVLVRFRLMTARCEGAAQASGATGGDWLAEALTCALGVARPRNLLNYADAVLNDWIHHKCDEKQSTRTQRSRTTPRRSVQTEREPAALAGIRSYLEKHAGIPSGDRD